MYRASTFPPTWRKKSIEVGKSLLAPQRMGSNRTNIEPLYCAFPIRNLLPTVVLLLAKLVEDPRVMCLVRLRFPRRSRRSRSRIKGEAPIFSCGLSQTEHSSTILGDLLPSVNSFHYFPRGKFLYSSPGAQFRQNSLWLAIFLKQ